MWLWTWISDALERTLGRSEPREERESPLPRSCDARDSALARMLWSAPLAAVTLAAVYALSQWGRFDGGFKLLGPVIAMLLVPFLVHATEVVSNARFSDLSERWEGLAGWQRGILGTGLVLLAGVAIFFLSLAFALYAAPPAS